MSVSAVPAFAGSGRHYVRSHMRTSSQVDRAFAFALGAGIVGTILWDKVGKPLTVRFFRGDFAYRVAYKDHSK